METAVELNPLESRVWELVPLDALRPTQRTAALASAQWIDLAPGEQLFEEGSSDAFAYYLVTGELVLTARDQIIKRLSGDSEDARLPIAQLLPRQLTACAEGHAVAIRFPRPLLERLITAATRDNASPVDATPTAESAPASADDGAWMNRLVESPLFSALPPANIQQLFERFEPVHYRAGQTVVAQGSSGQTFFVVQLGECQVLRQAAPGSRPVKLAVLSAGDTFGEESLLGGGPRNASIVMRTDGVVGQLSAEDFESLVGAPSLRELSVADAEAAVAGGAVWLDVRFPEEHTHGAPAGAVNIPLNTLRVRASRLNPQQHYICCSGDGRRARVAAFLLATHGIHAAYLGDSLTRVLGLPVDAPALPEIDFASFEDAPLIKPASSTTPAVVVRRAQLAKERNDMAAARAAAAARLEQAEAARRADLDETLAREEKARREALEARLAAAAKAQKARHQAEIDRELAARATALKQMREEEAALAAALADARRQVAQTGQLAQQRLAEVREHERELETARVAAAREAESREQRQAALLARLREESVGRMEAEKVRLQAALDENSAALEAARAERVKAEQARAEAHAEVARALAEAREQFAAMRDAENRRIAAARAKLKAEADKLKAQFADAHRARAIALAAKKAAEAEAAKLLDEARRAGASAAPEDGKAPAATGLQKDLAAADASLRAASQRLVEASDAERSASAALEANQTAMARHDAVTAARHAAFQRDIEGWLEEQAALESSPERQEIRTMQSEQVARVKAQAEAARRAARQHDQSLLDELAAQLKGAD